HVVDYTKEDYTRSGQRYDLIVDNVANRSLLENRRILNPKGRYILVGGGGVKDNRWIGSLTRPLRALVVSRFVSQDLRMMLADMGKPDLSLLGNLIAAGKIKPVIDRRYKLGEAAEALRYLETGHARGKVILTVEGDAVPMAVTGASTGDGG